MKSRGGLPVPNSPCTVSADGKAILKSVITDTRDVLFLHCV